MKANYIKAFLMFLLGCFCQGNADAQDIRGDTIQVDENSVVEVIFPSSPGKAELSVSDGQEGMYEVNEMGKKSLSIKALKKGAKEQALEVNEGGRKHLFILSYKEGSPARRIDFSSKKKLSARVTEIKKEVVKALNAANSFYDQAINNISNQTLWEQVEAEYLKLVNIADSKDVDVVKFRLEDSRRRIQVIKDKNYNDAMKEGQDYFSLKRYGEARKSYLKALAERPGDPLASKNLNLNDSVWAKGYVDKGDEANKAKKYVLAKSNYREALSIKADYPFLQNKFNQAKKDADPLIYDIEKAKGDQAMGADDIPGARRAYDSALSVRPGNPYIESQLKKLVIEEERIKQEEKQESLYQERLATAKSLADKAVNKEGYNLAIQEYQRALSMFPTRKFPKKKINELTKIKNALQAN